MREIKFRAWDKSRKRMMTDPKWVEFKFKVKGLSAVNFTPQGNEQFLDVMQCTGLKDKNGAEIYEGDILRACGDSFYAVVEFDDRELMFSAKLYQNGYKIVSMGLTRFMRSRERAVNGKIKIIGNIHKHPELLEKNND